MFATTVPNPEILHTGRSFSATGSFTHYCQLGLHYALTSAFMEEELTSLVVDNGSDTIKTG